VQQNTSAAYISETDKAYLAGLFDGEGSIGIYRYKNKQCTYITTVTIGMCEPQGPILAHSLYGGYLNIRPPRAQSKKNLNVWMANNEEAERFLIEVLPYLRAKRDQAHVFLEFRQTYLRYNRAGRGAKVPADVIDLRDRLVTHCKALKRGA
jgi:hypothetical protein